LKACAIITAVLIAANAFAGLGDTGVHAPAVRSAAYPNSARYLWALGEIESGNDDMAHGRRGEIGRYQCMKAVWHNATAQPFSAATNPAIAATVTQAIIRARTGLDPAELTPERFGKAWHCPNARHLNREQRDYVERFTALANR
jgi:hypothetical protein